MPHKATTWVALVDGHQACFYTKDDNNRLSEAHSGLTLDSVNAREFRDSGDLGRVHDRMGAGRHKMEPSTSLKTKERQNFTQEVADFLEQALQRGDFERLVLASPPQTLGLLREQLSQNVKNTIVLELDKDLIQYRPDQLQDYLENEVHL
jgi:protein required for attachment to host cells